METFGVSLNAEGTCFYGMQVGWTGISQGVLLRSRFLTYCFSQSVLTLHASSTGGT